MKVGFSNTTLKPEAERGMAHTTISKTQASSYQQIKNQDNGHNLFYSRGVAHKEFVPPGVTMNQKYYLEVLNCLRKRVMRVRMEIVYDWILRTSSRQRARTHSIVSSLISGEKVHSHASAGSLFSRLLTL
jgi:hypothetical protein